MSVLKVWAGTMLALLSHRLPVIDRLFVDLLSLNDVCVLHVYFVPSEL